DVGRLSIEPRIEHADGRGMFELLRQPEPADQRPPSPGVRPRPAQVADLDRRLVIALDRRAIGDPVRARTELGQEPVSIQRHRSPRPARLARSPGYAASRLGPILRDGTGLRERPGTSPGGTSPSWWR